MAALPLNHPRLLNLGCGSSCHQDWINLDLAPRHPLAQACDLRQGIPYPNNSVDACYSSHVLEHLDKTAGAKFLAEQFRVLKSGGIIRVVVPDLETICRNYLKFLEASVAGDPRAEFRYDYSLLELFDQTTRRESGGDMGKLWQSGTISDLDFVLARHGEEARPHIRMGPPASPIAPTPAHTVPPAQKSAWLRLRGRLGCLCRKSQKQPQPPAIDRLLALAEELLGEEGRASVMEGLFRNSGEIHRVMYDRFSLGRALTRAGFSKIRVCAHDESQIARFQSTGLDGNAQGPRKPDSLYMEASKPGLNS